MCVHVCIRRCVSLYLFVNALLVAMYAGVCIYACMYEHVYVCMQLHLYISIYGYVCTCLDIIYKHTCVAMYVNACACVYVLIYVRAT